MNDAPFSEDLRRALEEEVHHHEHNTAACISVLRRIQQDRGWVDDASLRAASAILGMSPADVDSVATFFNLIHRRPVGRHIILICDSVSCWVMGYEALRQHLVEALGVELGGTTEDERFTLLPIVCLGACDRAPAMMVDDDLYGPVSPEQIPEILAKYE